MKDHDTSPRRQIDGKVTHIVETLSKIKPTETFRLDKSEDGLV
jgi:hypothetical protein